MQGESESDQQKKQCKQTAKILNLEMQKQIINNMLSSLNQPISIGFQGMFELRQQQTNSKVAIALIIAKYQNICKIKNMNFKTCSLEMVNKKIQVKDMNKNPWGF